MHNKRLHREYKKQKKTRAGCLAHETKLHSDTVFVIKIAGYNPESIDETEPEAAESTKNGRKYATEVQMKAELPLRVGDVICILVDGGSVHPDLL